MGRSLLQQADTHHERGEAGRIEVLARRQHLGDGPPTVAEVCGPLDLVVEAGGLIRCRVHVDAEDVLALPVRSAVEVERALDTARRPVPTSATTMPVSSAQLAPGSLLRRFPRIDPAAGQLPAGSAFRLSRVGRVEEKQAFVQANTRPRTESRSTNARYMPIA